MTTIATYTNGQKSVSIIRKVKEGTKRVFFYPITSDGLRINSTLYARQYDAVSLAKLYLNK